GLQRADRTAEVDTTGGGAHEVRDRRAPGGHEGREGQVPPLEARDRVAAAVGAVGRGRGNVVEADRVVVRAARKAARVGEAAAAGGGDAARIGGGFDVDALRHHRGGERVDGAHVHLEAAHQLPAGEETGAGADRRGIRARVCRRAEKELRVGVDAHRHADARLVVDRDDVGGRVDVRDVPFRAQPHFAELAAGPDAYRDQ